MTLRVFEPKTITLVSNTAQSVTWAAPEFFKYWGDVIVYGNVSVRFQINNACTNAVYVSLNYATRTENIPFQERKNIAGIAKNTAVELSRATVPAIGQLKDQIQSITLTFICAVSGTVTITLQILDSDDLTSDSGGGSSYIGTDTTLSSGAVIKNVGVNGNAVPGFVGVTVVYTVPIGKRFEMLASFVVLGPTPSYPGMAVFTFSLVSGLTIGFYSKTDEFINQQMYTLPLILTEGDALIMSINNTSNTVVDYAMGVSGNEIF